MKSRTWLIITASLLCIFLAGVISIVIYVDPVFHYHKPNENLYYSFFDERMLNDGVVRNFDYDAIITGTSLMEVARTSEFDDIYDTRAIKVTAASGTYYEISSNVRKGLRTHPDTKMVVRALDLPEHLVITPSDTLSDYVKDTFPYYLYNESVLDDFHYCLISDIISDRCIPMIQAFLRGEEGGTDSFDHYYYDWITDGISPMSETTDLDSLRYQTGEKRQSLSREEKAVIQKNVRENLTSLAEEYPNVKFLYFFPPDCITGWGYRYEAGAIERQIEIERTIAQELVPYKNVYLYDFTMIDEIFDLSRYCDDHHFDDGICTSLFRMMRTDQGRITLDNLDFDMGEQLEFFSKIRYEQLGDLLLSNSYK